MNKTIKLQGRELTTDDIDFIRLLVADNPTWHRRKLSVALAEAWDWRNAKGDLKDMASRTLMLKLHDRGTIELPPRRRPPTKRTTQGQIQTVLHDTSPIEALLSALQPLKVITVPPRSEYEPVLCQMLNSSRHW